MTTYNSVNPAKPEDVVGTFPIHTAADVDAAVAAATQAQKAWALVPIPARGELIAGVGKWMAEHKSELTALVAREAGKVLIEAGGDVQEAIDMAAFVAGQARGAWGTVHASELANKIGWTTRQPVGVVGMITPWNFPVAIPSWKIFPALLAGNGIVIKPSELAPACAEAFVHACTEAGIPKDLIQVVHGFGEVGAAISNHVGVHAVSFTGSVTTGRKVAVSAMENGPRVVSLELGGKNAMVVLADADIDLAVDGVLFGAFGTAGQRCTSTSRLILHNDIADEVIAKVAERVRALKIGNPSEPGIDVGPVINKTAQERINTMVQAAVAEGAEVLVGGTPVTVAGFESGTFYAPTILTNVQRTHRIALDEVFGPVLSVIRVGSVEEAFETVNEAEYGLSAAIYTQDINVAMHAIDIVNTGIVYVNAPTIGAEIHLPFGGTKHTGNGFREAGTRGLEQFSEVKSVYVDYSGRLQRAQIDNRPNPNQ